MAKRFDASPRREKGVGHLQGLARTSVTVDALPLEQIGFGLPYELGGQAYSPTGLRESMCRPVRICSLIDSGLIDALRIVTKYLRPTPKDNLPVFSGIKPAELRRQRAMLFLANRSSLDRGHILHGQLTEPRAASKERLKSKRPFISAERKLFHNLSELGIRPAQRMNLTWDIECSESILALGVYILRVSARPIGMSLTRTAWVKLNRLCTGVGRFGSSMHK